jgi:hypothetical protein
MSKRQRHAELVLENKLLTAVVANDIREIKSLLPFVNIDCHDSLGRTPLMLAVFNGNTNVVKVLLEAGANVNARDIHGSTPLIYVGLLTRIDSEKIAEMLLKAGADIHARDAYGNSAHHYARPEIKKMLERWDQYMGLYKSLKKHGATGQTRDLYSKLHEMLGFGRRKKVRKSHKKSHKRSHRKSHKKSHRKMRFGGGIKMPNRKCDHCDKKACQYATITNPFNKHVSEFFSCKDHKLTKESHHALRVVIDAC